MVSVIKQATRVHTRGNIHIQLGQVYDHLNFVPTLRMSQSAAGIYYSRHIETSRNASGPEHRVSVLIWDRDRDLSATSQAAYFLLI
jgi:hypothetical protein